MIEQLSSAGNVAEVLETLAEQEKVKFSLFSLRPNILCRLMKLNKQVKTQQLTQAVATIHHLQKLANHLGQAS